MSNTNDVNQVVATILSELYEAFPTRLSLYAKALYVYENHAENNKVPLIEPDELPQELLVEAKRYNETLRWLKHEGFLRVGNERYYPGKRGGSSSLVQVIFDEVVLTPKGYTVLNSPSVSRVESGGGGISPIAYMLKSVRPESWDKLTRGQLIRHVLQSGSPKYLRIIINEIVSTAIRDNQEG